MAALGGSISGGDDLHSRRAVRGERPAQKRGGVGGRQREIGATFQGNAASNGAAIYKTDDITTISNSTFVDNTASNIAQIYSYNIRIRSHKCNSRKVLNWVITKFWVDSR